MKHAYFLLPILLITIAAIDISCSKSNSSGKPKISLKSINTDISVNEDLIAKFQVTSGGAVVDTFIFIRVRVNQIPLPPGSENIDTLTGTVPSYPDQNKVDFQYQLPYVSLHEAPTPLIDTFVFKYAVIDKAGHSSDTLTTPQIFVKSQ